MFRQLPLSEIMTLVLIFVAFVSHVTAADSNTDAIGNLWKWLRNPELL